jgi:DNA-directed RNA polymerase beta' subunit
MPSSTTGFHYATRAGLTVSVWDAVIPPEKQEMLDEAQEAVDEINENYEDGLLSESERHAEVVNAWTECTDELGSKMLNGFSEDNPIYMMADSGARGSKTQLRQLAGMRGLMADMSGDTIDLPSRPTSARACSRSSTSSPPTAPARASWTRPPTPPTPATSPVVWSTWRRTSSCARRTAAPTEASPTSSSSRARAS